MSIKADRVKVAGVHPDLIAKIDRVLSAMFELGHPMQVIEGLRTTARQKALYAQGRTMPGPIVTHCDGVTTRSNHQVNVDGFGHAIDCAFLDDPLTPENETWSDRSPWMAYGACVKAVGLNWGGDWLKSITDRPHAELPG